MNKRVLIVGPTPPPLGGMETYVGQFLRSGIAKEYDLLLQRTHVVDPARFAGLFGKAATFANAGIVLGSLVREMRSFKPGIVHLHTNSYTGFYKMAVYASLCRRMGAKTVLHIHGGEFQLFYRNSRFGGLIRDLINANDAVVVLSERWLGFFKSIGVHGEKIHVLKNCVEIPLRAEGSGGVPVFLFLSRIEKQKGVSEIIQAAQLMHERIPEARIVMAGPRSHGMERIEQDVKAAGMEKYVEFRGPVVGVEKDSAYRTADVYLLPSHAEGMPMGLLEAMSYGLSCITTPVGGIPDVIKNGENGLLVKPGDAGGLAEAMIRLAGDKEYREKLGSAARRTITERFCWDKRASEISALYRRLL